MQHPADEVIKEAEAGKARMYATPGNQICNDLIDNFLRQTRDEGQMVRELSHSALIDKNYITMGTHIDKSLADKIIAGEYMDFARLLPRDRIAVQDDHQMELVSRGGLTYFVPVADRETNTINNFSKWEQAFRIYSNEYLKKYPHRQLN